MQHLHHYRHRCCHHYDRHHHQRRSRHQHFRHHYKMFHFPFLENYGDGLPPSLSLMQHGFHTLNRYQETAVREALSRPFTLIQGPPGTSCTPGDLLTRTRYKISV